MMSNHKEAKTKRHQEVWELLPWYVNGTLKDPDRDMVAHHISECSACADELAKCRSVAAALRDPEMTEWTPSPEKHVARFMAHMQDMQDSERSPFGDFVYIAACARLPDYINIVVADDITEEELKALVSSVEGEIVEGPSPTMAYIVRVPLTVDTSTALETLRAHPKVRQANLRSHRWS